LYVKLKAKRSLSFDVKLNFKSSEEAYLGAPLGLAASIILKIQIPAAAASERFLSDRLLSACF
jgi:hypothetical protein